VQGLVAQGRTIWETLEIARDVARKMLEESGDMNERHLESFDYPLVVEVNGGKARRIWLSENHQIMRGAIQKSKVSSNPLLDSRVQHA